MNLLFVHGINVRGDAWFASLDLISRKAKRFLPDFEVTGCGWGDPFGARLHRNGISIPNYDRTGDAFPADERASRARWHLLSSDPLLELRLLPQELPELGMLPGGEEILTLVPRLEDDGTILNMLKEWGVDKPWAPFIQGIMAERDWKTVVTDITLSPAAASEPVARAITAGYLQQLRLQGFPALSGDQRDQLKNTLVNLVGGPPLGIGDWFLTRLTNAAVKRRGGISDLSTPAVGDIIHYQARGRSIRNFIAKMAKDCKADVVLAHSLGGVACVDWLASGENPVPSAQKLVTVGSQAGYFYEVDGLASTPFGTGLPSTFPGKWLNIFDRADLLGFLAEPIFPQNAIDFEVDSGQPFPASHSAYWQNDVVWERIAGFLED
jgi:hypothetical protein